MTSSCLSADAINRTPRDVIANHRNFAGRSLDDQPCGLRLMLKWPGRNTVGIGNQPNPAGGKRLLKEPDGGLPKPWLVKQVGSHDNGPLPILRRAAEIHRTSRELVEAILTGVVRGELNGQLIDIRKGDIQSPMQGRQPRET